MYARYDIPCPHEGEDTPEDSTHSDYYPLTKEDITQLCHIAQHMRSAGNLRTLASIQSRLCQGIVGMTCPVPGEGPVSDAESRLSEYFVTNLEWYGSDPTFVDELYEIIHLPEKEEN